MNYDVIIHTCKDPVTAATIAQRIAVWAGKTPEAVYAIITSKAACVRKGADEALAHALKEEYEKLGAHVELQSVGLPLAPLAAAKNDDDDDDEAVEGRLLSDEEYVARVNKRGDIFYFEGTKELFSIESVALVLAVVAGIFLSTREIVPIMTSGDFLEPGQNEVILSGEEVPRPPKPQEVQEKQNVARVSENKVLKPSPHQSNHTGGGGGGDPRARITRKGLLGIISGSIVGKSVVNADIFSKGGFATDVDAILSGVGGLKNGGTGGTGRRVAPGIGFGPGYNSGTGGSGGIGDLVDNLMLSTTPGMGELKKRGRLEVSPPQSVRGGSLTSGRSKSGIMQVVMQNLSALRHAYNKRLQEKPGLKGRITVKFAIDEFGNVLFCSMEESTMGDETLELLVVSRIKHWKFDAIDKPGDVTEVVYPFVFSQ